MRSIKQSKNIKMPKRFDFLPPPEAVCMLAAVGFAVAPEKRRSASTRKTQDQAESFNLS